MTQKEKSDVAFLGGCFFAAPIACCAMLITACPGDPKVPPPSIEVAQAQGDCVAFRVQKQLGCVIANKTKAEIDACRAGVELATDCTDGGWSRFMIADGGGQ